MIVVQQENVHHVAEKGGAAHHMAAPIRWAGVHEHVIRAVVQHGILHHIAEKGGATQHNGGTISGGSIAALVSGSCRDICICRT